jgi:hypothetical protein
MSTQLSHLSIRITSHIQVTFLILPQEFELAVARKGEGQAMERMRQAGAVITTAQAAAFEMVGAAGTPLFRQAQPVLKNL